MFYQFYNVFFPFSNRSSISKASKPIFTIFFTSENHQNQILTFTIHSTISSSFYRQKTQHFHFVSIIQLNTFNITDTCEKKNWISWSKVGTKSRSCGFSRQKLGNDWRFRGTRMHLGSWNTGLCVTHCVSLWHCFELLF